MPAGKKWVIVRRYAGFSARCAMSESLYDTDFHAWTSRQAAALRRVAELRLNLPDVDVEHLAEEVEDMGKSEARAARSALTVIIEHLLKLRYSPAVSPRNGWRDTVHTQRRRIDDVFTDSPGLKNEQRRAEMFAEAWRRGRYDACAGLNRYGEEAASAAIPTDCPFTFEQLCDFEWWPEPVAPEPPAGDDDDRA
jgi:hypothetical protein